MTIAVNTRFLLKDYLEGYGYFLYETFSRIVKKHPEHRFVFIFDRPYDKRFIFGSNVKAVVTGPPARHPLLWKLWYDIKIPAVLKKYKADVFVSCDGFCSLNTSVPQCLVLHDLAFLHYPSFNKKSHLFFYKRYTPKFLSKAKSVATVSEFSKKDILSQYKMEADKIDIAYSAAKKIFQPLNDETKQALKEKYTEGKEYFLYTGAIHPRKNLMNLLKAFSVFKKRQQTNMKLVLAGRLAWKYESFTKSLESYKYRKDVVMTGYVAEEELVKITGSAYALVYPSLLEGFGVPVLEAMQCDVPVITSANSSMQEIAKDAALYADANSHIEIADKMMLLYKDENLRRGLIQKGKLVVQQYSWDKTAELLWQSILKAHAFSGKTVG
jgi:glycosyltransferase involved in cell wall biosynthesis